MRKTTIKLGMVTAAALLVCTVASAGGDITPMTPAVDTTAPAKAPSAWKSKHKFFGFSQIGAQMGDGAKIGKDSDIGFEFDRIRLGWKYFSGNLAAKVFLDFAKKGTDNGSVGVPDMVKDAFIAYKFDDAMVLKAGVIKTPVGMGFTIPGWNLDVIKRGFDKKLAFERAAGLMLSGRDIGFGNNGKVDGLEMGHERPWKGFGYDIMLGENAGRSKAVNHNTIDEVADAKAYAIRGMFDWTEIFHGEASYALQEKAGGLNSVAYKSYTIGIDSTLGKTNIKAEYLKGANVLGYKDDNQKTLTLTGSYSFTNQYEGVIKYINSKANIGNISSDLTNSYLGFNIFLNPKNNKMSRMSKRSRNANKIVINYVNSRGDKEGFHKGLGGYGDNVWIVQFQSKF